jgi:signal transduction histidine kinase
MAFPNASETALANLIHDLRQPLGNIESSTWCLSSLTGHSDPRVREQVALIERQVQAAENLLTAAAAELSRARVQRAEAAAGIEVSNSAS